VNVVFDTNVVASAIFWPGESRDCLVLWAKREFDLAISVPIFEEYCEVSHRLGRRLREVNPDPWLHWIERKAKVYEPVPLGRGRSRDPDDDPFLACALACSAKIVVSKDKDLLVLEKPFGVEILLPRQFLVRFR
jgi:uncharacterized protein